MDHHVCTWSYGLIESVSSVGAINPLVACNDIHGRKREVLFFSYVSETLLAFYWLLLLTRVYYYGVSTSQNNKVKVKNKSV
jgi:hypothetical protein